MTTRPATSPTLRRLPLLLLTALAADALAQSAAPDTVVVTGTRARDRTVITSTAPIDVLTAEDLQRAAGNSGDLALALQTLLPSFNFPRQSNSSGADHVRPAQLRGLSPDQVLVLVNGKRRHTAAVVNLDSKIGKGTNPVDLNAIPLNAVQRIEVLRDGAGAQYGSDAIAGVINIVLEGSGSGSVLEAGTGAFHTKFEPTGQHITDGQNLDLRAKSGVALNGGALRFGVELGTRKATNRAGLDQVPFFEDQTPANLALQGQRNYAAGEPAVDALNLWANGSRALGGTHTAYAFATLNRRNSVGSAFFRYPDGSANVKSIYPQGFRPETTGRNTDLQLVGGVRGNLDADWSYDASLNFGGNRFDYGLRHSLNASLGPASPTSFDLGRFAFDQTSANLDLTRELRLPGIAAPWTLALGGELRRDQFRTRAGDPASYAAGDAGGSAGAQAGPGLQPVDAVSLGRTLAGVYADFGGALLPGLDTNAALRWDHSSDFGGAGTGKLSARWAMAPGVALRGAASTNYRAPSLAQRGFSFTVSDFGEGGQLTQVRLLPVEHPIARELGARDLKAETSRNLSAGFTWQPAKQTTLTIDAYRIDIDDRITLSQRFSRGDDSFNFFTNAIDTRTRGVDLVANHVQRVGAGELQLSLASSFTRTRIRRLDPGAGVGLEEVNTLTDAAPRQRHVLSATWHEGRFTGLLRATRHGSTTRVFDFGDGFVPTQTYAPVWQFDLEAEWQLTPALSMAIGGVNIGDRYPTRSIDDISYFGNFPYDVLSPIGFNGAAYYARLRYAF